LKLEASINIQSILVTLDVFHFVILALNNDCPANPTKLPEAASNADISVTAETSQSRIAPYALE
jgi:hypothetical protein